MRTLLLLIVASLFALSSTAQNKQQPNNECETPKNFFNPFAFMGLDSVKRTCTGARLFYTDTIVEINHETYVLYLEAKLQHVEYIEELKERAKKYPWLSPDPPAVKRPQPKDGGKEGKVF